MVSLRWILVREREVQGEVLLRCLREIGCFLVYQGEGHRDEALFDRDAKVHGAAREYLDVVDSLRMEGHMLGLLCRDDPHQFVVQAFYLPVCLLNLLARVVTVDVPLIIEKLWLKLGHDGGYMAVLKVCHPRDAGLQRLRTVTCSNV